MHTDLLYLFTKEKSVSGSAGLFGLFYIKIPLTAILDRFEKNAVKQKTGRPGHLLIGRHILKKLWGKAGNDTACR